MFICLSLLVRFEFALGMEILYKKEGGEKSPGSWTFPGSI